VDRTAASKDKTIDLKIFAFAVDVWRLFVDVLDDLRSNFRVLFRFFLTALLETVVVGLVRHSYVETVAFRLFLVENNEIRFEDRLLVCDVFWFSDVGLLTVRLLIERNIENNSGSSLIIEIVEKLHY
jgi:hypothetical protein